MPQPQSRPVKLGEHDYVVFPQKIGYLMNKLGPRLQEAIEAEIDGVGGANMVGVKAHDVLKVFIPDLMPVWEFCGFASEEAMLIGQDAYDEDADKSPSAPEVRAAFTASSDVNGGEILSHLKALAGAMAPEVKQKLTSFIAAKLAEQGTKTSRSPISAPSPTSPSTSGDSGSTSSSTPPPMSEPSGV